MQQIEIDRLTACGKCGSLVWPIFRHINRPLCPWRVEWEQMGKWANESGAAHQHNRNNSNYGFALRIYAHRDRDAFLSIGQWTMAVIHAAAIVTHFTIYSLFVVTRRERLPMGWLVTCHSHSCQFNDDEVKWRRRAASAHEPNFEKVDKTLIGSEYCDSVSLVVVVFFAAIIIISISAMLATFPFLLFFSFT